MLKFVKYVVSGLATLIVLMMIGMAVFALNDRRVDYDVALGDTVVPKFTQVEVAFDQQHKDATSLPITGSAAIDIDGDGAMELFIGGGFKQENGLFRFQNGTFQPVDGIAGLTKMADGTAFGTAVLDVNKDGRSDLLVTHPEGIWLYTNNGGSFTASKLNTQMNEDTTGLSIAVADVNRDGHFDMFVAGYIQNEKIEGLNIFNKPGYGGTSELFINNGDNTFRNETKQRGLEYLHNTFQATFGDFEGDGDLDLIVAHDTGHVRTWQNDGTGNFTNIENPISNLPSYPMGIAIADLNNDGLTDYSFSNIGSTPPTFMVRGDLREEQPLNRKWMAFIANGDGNFTEQGEAMRIANYEFGWGVSHEDLNLDGREDMIGSQNFVTAPFHKIGFLRLPGRLWVQTDSGEMAEVGADAGVVNRQYSIAPLTADFNADGRPDIVHINIAGKSQAFISKGNEGNNFLKVRLPDNVTSIGAKILVTLADGTTLNKPFVLGEGLASDSSHVIIAGLGKQAAKAVKVTYLNGTVDEKTGPFSNETLNFESAATGN